MKASVIVRTYNRPDFLKEALLSIEFQTHKDWEVVIFDDKGSAENFEIYSKFRSRNPDKRILYLTSQTPFEFFGDSWLIAPDVVGGEIMIRLDDDDLLAEDALEFLTELYEKNTHLEFSYGSSAVFNQQGLTKVVESKTPYEIPKTTAIWAGYVNEWPWNYPWAFINDYYKEPHYHSSIIHCSKANHMCIVHPYVMRTSAVKKVKDKIKMSSKFVDDLEFLGSLDNLGLGHNSLKKVITYLREHNVDRVTNKEKSIDGITLWNDIFRVRDEVDYLRPSGFMSRIVPIKSDKNSNNGVTEELNNNFINFKKRINEFVF